MDTHTVDTTSTEQLKSFLLDLACRQDELAAEKAARVPTWAPCPLSVLGHHAAALALRAEARALQVAN
jgi:hypothetical protein